MHYGRSIRLGEFARFWATWRLVAIATVVAALIVVVMEITSVVDISGARPPYRSSTFAWLRYLLGGLMFGVGMTLAGGCVSRNLVRFGGGNLKSLVTLLIAGVFAYFMTKTAFYEVGFYSWIHPISVDLAPLGIQSQDVGSIISAILPSVSGLGVRITVVVLLAMFVVWFVLKTRGIQGNVANISAGFGHRRGGRIWLVSDCRTDWYGVGGKLPNGQIHHQLELVHNLIRLSIL